MPLAKEHCVNVFKVNYICEEPREERKDQTFTNEHRI